MEGACRKPWISHPGVDSFSARYLCVEPGYRVLKRWKLTQGSALDGKILVPYPPLLETWIRLRPDLITWIPQPKARSWRLGASPAEKIARWVSAQIGVRAQATMRPGPLRVFGRRQAELRMHERMSNRLRLDWNEDAGHVRGATVLLVDDFMTTGRTLRAGAQVLKSRGALAVHAFCLGVRPLLESGVRGDRARREIQSACDLRQGARGPVSVGHELKPLDR